MKTLLAIIAIIGGALLFLPVWPAAPPPKPTKNLDEAWIVTYYCVSKNMEYCNAAAEVASGYEWETEEDCVRVALDTVKFVEDTTRQKFDYSCRLGKSKKPAINYQPQRRP